MRLLWEQVLILITQQARYSRYAGIMSGILSWVCMLIYTPGSNKQAATEPFTAWPFQGWIDISIVLSLVMSISASLWHWTRLMDTRDQRMIFVKPYKEWCLRFLQFMAAYFLLVGIAEMSFILTSSTIDSQLNDTDWVFPPDRVDCSKVYALLFCCCKIIFAVYLFLMALKVRHDTHNESAETIIQLWESQLCQVLAANDDFAFTIPQMKNLDSILSLKKKHHNKYRVKQMTWLSQAAALGLTCFLMAQVVICLIEQQTGPKFMVQLATMQNATQTLLLDDFYHSGDRFLSRRFLVLAANSSSSAFDFATPICSSTNSHFVEAIMSFAWLILLLLCYLLRDYSKEWQRCLHVITQP